MKRRWSSAKLREATLRTPSNILRERADEQIAMLVAMKRANSLLMAQGTKELFASETDDQRRTELFDAVGDLCGDVREKYAWACPDDRALSVLAHFSPLVEVGAGHGYWAHLLRERGADILAFDLIAPESRAAGAKAVKSAKVQAEARGVNVGAGEFWTDVRRGGAEVLATAACARRSLFLCFPDEISELSLECLRKFTGDTIIHVGELIGDGNLCLTSAPWGRTTTPTFQVS